MQFSHLLSGVAWSLLGKVGQFLLGLAAVAVIARELGPEIYGVYALGWIVLGLFDIVIGGAPTDALVQREEARPGHFNVTFCVTLAIALLAGLGIAAFAGPMAGWLGGGTLLAAVLPIRAIGLPLKAISVGPLAMLLRASRFRAVAGVEMAASIASSALGIMLALNGAGVWSLVAMELARIAVQCGAMIVLSGWRPGFAMRRADLNDLAAFNTSTWVSWGMGYLDSQLPRLVASLTMGPVAVGYLSLAQRLYESVSDVLVVPVYNVIQAGTARAQRQIDDVRRLIAGALTLGTLCASPLFLGLAAVVPLLVPLAFGAQWQDAVPAVQLMALGGVRLAVATVQSAALRGLGKPHWDMVSAVTQTGASVTLMLLAAPFGLEAMLVALLIGGWLVWPLDAWYVRRLTGLGFFAQIQACLRTLAAALPMMGLVLLVIAALAAHWPPVPMLLAAIAVGAVAYWLLLYGAMPGAARHIARLLHALARGNRAAVRDWFRTLPA